MVETLQILLILFLIILITAESNYKKVRSSNELTKILDLIMIIFIQ